MISHQARDDCREEKTGSHIKSAQHVLMKLEKCISHLDFLEQGEEGSNNKMQNEHLGKMMAIVSELYSSVPMTDKSEEARLLRCIYGDVFRELSRFVHEK